MGRSRKARFPNQTALVVDDTGTILKLLTRMLERKQFTVTCAQNGAEALERLQAQHFNLALLDVQMPRMDGIECTRRLRKWEAGAVCVLFFFTRPGPLGDVICFSGQPVKRKMCRLLQVGRSASARRRQLIVGLSANSEVEDRAVCAAAGMDDFLAKVMRRRR